MMAKKSSMKTRSDPNLVLAYLYYALADVSGLSKRSTQYLKQAIATLAEDSRVLRPTRRNGKKDGMRTTATRQYSRRG
jgi:hypothetical protein